MRIVWDRLAWEDYLWWQTQDRKVLERINLLVHDIVRHGEQTRRTVSCLERWSR